MLMSQTDLAALVCSRMCHDLVSPIGAIGNGLELLELSDMRGASELALISDSVQQANARIRLFRMAFGHADPTQMVPRKEVLSVLTSLAHGSRNAYLWQAPGDHSRQAVRCALLALLCLDSALPLGGDITVSLSGETWQVSATADRLNAEPALWDYLTAPSSSLTFQPNTVQFALLPLAASAMERRIQVIRPDDSTLMLSF